MERLPNLESCLRLAYEARGGVNLSGIALASYFSRAPTRGRRRSDLEPDLIFSQTVRDRLDRELSVINQLGFSNYFLIVWDFVRYARERDVPAPQRLVAAGAHSRPVHRSGRAGAAYRPIGVDARQPQPRFMT